MISRLRDEQGIALLTVILLLVVMVGLGVLITGYGIRSNDVTVFDRQRENAFQAADAGVADAVRCLGDLNPNNYASGMSACNDELLNTAPLELRDQERSVGSYRVAMTDAGTIAGRQQVDVDSWGFGGRTNTDGTSRVTRYIRARVELIPLAGFFETIFAGGPGAKVEIKNNTNVQGNVYSESITLQQNNATISGAVRAHGNFDTKNNNTYHSVTAGGDLLIGDNTTIKTVAEACGSNPSAGPGNATVGKSTVNQLLRYQNTLSTHGSASIGAISKTPCPNPPPLLNLPTFDPAVLGSSAYANWNALSFTGATGAADATACLKELDPAKQPLVCNGKAWATAPGRIGASSSTYGGTLIRVEPSGSCSTVTMPNKAFTFENNVTIYSTCRVDPNGSYSLDTTVKPKAQFVVIAAVSGVGIDANNVTSTNGNLSVLLYTTGDLVGKNDVTIAAGALYGKTVTIQNNLDIAHAPDLVTNPPLGFVFDPALAVKVQPIIADWRELAAPAVPPVPTPTPAPTP